MTEGWSQGTSGSLETPQHLDPVGRVYCVARRGRTRHTKQVALRTWTFGNFMTHLYAVFSPGLAVAVAAVAVPT